MSAPSPCVDEREEHIRAMSCACVNLNRTYENTFYMCMYAATMRGNNALYAYIG
jgi:hypothetical protein